LDIYFEISNKFSPIASIIDGGIQLYLIFSEENVDDSSLCDGMITIFDKNKD
jgi:hypothetical protein